MAPYDSISHLPPNPTVQDAIEFIESAFQVIGVGFHPDTPFEQYLDFENEERLFDANEARNLFWEMVIAAEMLAWESEDAYDLCSRLANESAFGVPNPIVIQG